MSTKSFTPEEIAILKANPFTYSVTEKQISFTKEFKELFWSEYEKRTPPAEIFKRHNYDPDMLGRGRISGFQQHLRKEVEANLPFTEGSRSPGERKMLLGQSDDVSADTIRAMQHKLDYLEQQMEFLKKISSARTTRK